MRGPISQHYQNVFHEIPEKKRKEKRRLNAFKKKRLYNAVKRVTNFKRLKTSKSFKFFMRLKAFIFFQAFLKKSLNIN